MPMTGTAQSIEGTVDQQSDVLGHHMITTSLSEILGATAPLPHPARQGDAAVTR